MEKATLYYHVKRKEDLLYLICKSSMEALQADVSQAIQGLECPLEADLVTDSGALSQPVAGPDPTRDIAGGSACAVTAAPCRNYHACERLTRPGFGG